MADRERIFDRYFRSSSASRHISGTGIGLSIAKRAAQAHGGSVWVSSGEEEGTTFFAALPAPEDIDRADSREESTRATELNSPLNSQSGSGLHPTGADLPARTFQRSMS
jgi:two-component system sensor histidine kinase KdpD